MEAARPADGHTHKMFMCKTAAADEISSSASSRILQVSKMSLPPGSLPFQTSQMLYPVFHAPMEETTVRLGSKVLTLQGPEKMPGSSISQLLLSWATRYRLNVLTGLPDSCLPSTPFQLTSQVAADKLSRLYTHYLPACL
ncbi:uncharacterized protein LOC144244802 isoform X1 [Crocuta crocuta]